MILWKSNEDDIVGLDNYIIVKSWQDIQEFAKYPLLERDDIYEYDICYWRKCWNIRNIILNNIEDQDKEKEEYLLSQNDIQIIIGILKSFNKDNWNDNGGSIWDWDRYRKKRLRENIKKLKHLLKMMKKYDFEVYFIDSY